jgi:hypothetical protein
MRNHTQEIEILRTTNFPAQSGYRVYLMSVRIWIRQPILEAYYFEKTMLHWDALTSVIINYLLKLSMSL